MFTGNKLQLYLYAKAVKQKYEKEGKQLAGFYYLPVNDKYEKEEEKVEIPVDGKTVNNPDAISEQGLKFLPTTKTGKIQKLASGNVLDKYVDYAVTLSEKAVERMQEGVIKASPYKEACEYCEYKAFCSTDGEERTVGKVVEQTITEATKGGKDNVSN